VQTRIGGTGREIIQFGLLDSAERSVEVAHQCRAADLDLLIVYITTYALSAVLLPVLRRNRVRSCC
jgi:L-arabinose isomerase